MIRATLHVSNQYINDFVTKEVTIDQAFKILNILEPKKFPSIEEFFKYIKTDFSDKLEK